MYLSAYSEVPGQFMYIDLSANFLRGFALSHSSDMGMSFQLLSVVVCWHLLFPE